MRVGRWLGQVLTELGTAGLQFCPVWPADAAVFASSWTTIAGPTAGHPERVTGQPATVVERHLWAQLEVSR